MTGITQTKMKYLDKINDEYKKLEIEYLIDNIGNICESYL
jgi:hypothetical protein